MVEAEQGVWYLFKMPGGKSPKNYSISGDVFVVGKKILSIVDLVGWRPESSEPDSETIAVKGGATSAPPPNTVPPPPPPTPLPNDEELEVPNAWFTENFRKYSRREELTPEVETPMSLVAK